MGALSAALPLRRGHRGRCIQSSDYRVSRDVRAPEGAGRHGDRDREKKRRDQDAHAGEDPMARKTKNEQERAELASATLRQPA